MIKMGAIKCLLCGDTVYSRTNHDFKRCYCGNVFMDGGPVFRNNESNGHYRCGAKILDKSEDTFIKLDVNATDLEKVGKILFDDWNNEENEFGLMRDESFTDEDREAARAKVMLLDN